MDVNAIRRDASMIAEQLVETGHIKDGLFVIGCSTSEVAGERIGTSGSAEVAEAVYEALEHLKKQTGVQLAFQCCEHLNRALVVERSIVRDYRLQEVAAVPVRKAGGSMAAYAYTRMDDPVLVETIEADGGLDIGDTLIGMHLKRVAVPLRLQQKSLGKAHITAARTRPPFIGGSRAVYERSQVEEGFCD